MKMVKMECPNCKGKMKMNEDDKTAVCPYCGMVVYLEDERPDVDIVNNKSFNININRGSQPNKPAPPAKRSKPIMFISILLMIAFLAVPTYKLLQSEGVLSSVSQPIVRQTPQSKTMIALTELIFGKNIDSVTQEDYDSIQYLELKCEEDEDFNSEYWTANFSTADPLGNDFADTIQSITLGNDESADWEDMTCFPHLVSLNLMKASLNESYSMDFRSLKKLKVLKLKDTHFSELGEMVADPEQICELAVSGYGDNLFEDATQFSNLQSLTVEALYSNTEIDSSPLASLTELSEFTISAIHDHHDISWLSSLTHLKKLHISASSDNISDFSVLYGMPALEELSIGSTTLKEIGFVKNMPALSKLEIGGAPLLDLSPLEGMTSLTALGLVDIDAVDYSVLASLSGLRSLTVTSYAIEEEMLPDLSGLPLLTEAYVHGSFAKALAGSTSLVLVQLYDADCRLDYLAGMNQLQEVGVITERWSGSAENANVLGTLPNLKRVTFRGPDLCGDDRQESSAYLAGLLQSPSLEQLTLDDMSSFEVDPNALPVSNTLTHFYLDGETETDALALIAHMPALTSLTVRNCNLTSLDFASGLAGLTKIDFSHNYVTDITPLAALPSLQYVDGRDNPVKSYAPLADNITIQS